MQRPGYRARASRLLADFPPPRVGDIWLDGPGCDETNGAWTVRTMDAPLTLVLHSMRDPITGRELDPADNPRLFIDTTWVFQLEELAPRRTRLLARTRIRVSPPWASSRSGGWAAGDTMMQRRLLDGIKTRVETTHSRVPLTAAPR
jgi:hypothetical protein